MIEESNTESPFFEINKKEIIALVPSQLMDLGKVTGWCNAFGYDLNVEFQEHKFIRLIKSQQTNQDIFFPRNSAYYYKMESKFEMDLPGRLLIGGTLINKFFNQTKKCKNHKIYYQDFPEELLTPICDLVELTNPKFLRIEKGQLRIVGNCRTGALGRIIEIFNELDLKSRRSF